MLYRNVGAGTLDKWTQDQKKDFFRKAGATAPDDRYSWETVKTVVIHTEVKSRMDSTETNVTAEALPMSVWLTRGYTKEAVESFPAEVCPKLGQLYAVPARADIWKEVRTKVEEEMQLCEKAITQVKALITVKAQAQKLSLPVESIEAALQDTEEKKTAANNVVMAGNHVAAHVPLPSRLFSKRQS